MKSFVTTLIAVLSVGISSAPLECARAADLTVEVQHVERSDGTVYVGLYNTAESFPKTVYQGLAAPAAERSASGTVRIVFHDIKPGEYAVSAFLDLDGDGKISTNMVGIPVEPYGFSRDAHGSMGPPSFQEAAFALPAEGSEVTIVLQ